MLLCHLSIIIKLPDFDPHPIITFALWLHSNQTTPREYKFISYLIHLNKKKKIFIFYSIYKLHYMMTANYKDLEMYFSELSRNTSSESNILDPQTNIIT